MKTENWKKVRLGDFVKIRTGKLDANASSDDGKYPFFTCSIEPLKISTYSYDCECVLVAGNGDLNVKYYNGKFDAYQRTYIIESLNKNILDVKFLYTFLSLYIETLRKLSIGGVIKYIKLANLTEALIPLPSLEIQKKISKTIKKSEKIIEENKQLLEKYDLLIKSRFIEMFGDKPVESGKWKVEKLEDVCDLITDGTHKTPNYQQKGIRFISAKNIINGKIDLTDTKFITEEEYKQIQKRCRVEKNDVLLTKSGSLGSSAIIDFDIPIGLFESLAVIKYKRNLLNGIFVKELLSAESSQKQFNNGVKGIAIKHLHLNVIAALKIPVPPLSLQNDFASFVQQIDKSKFTVQKSLEKAETLYKSLMQQYFA